MLCFVYRSKKKDEMYLYVLKRDDFSKVPDNLLKLFGQPEYALSLDLAKRTKLAREDIQQVKQKLEDDGFYLQMPPPVEKLKLSPKD
ncbi:MAG: YcgL domain-containing protein [Gammaproteobacteria bacterium]|nr:YcgL domain-containing protein [Gammaproteobacteria bacterium]